MSVYTGYTKNSLWKGNQIMMKKKILALSMVACLAVTAVVGGTLAYFIDTDAKTNTFTVGNVSIDLQENFTPESELMPGKDVAKEVWIKNDGDNRAFVWYEWLIPSALDSTDGSTGTNNILHVNSYGRTWDTYRENSKYWAEGQTKALPLESTWDHDPEIELGEGVGPEGFVGTVEIDDIEYNKYVTLYHGILGADESTTPAMSKVYVDPKVDAETDAQGNVTYYLVEDGNKTEIHFNLANTKIIVNAYGIQAEGLKDVDEDGEITVYDAYKLYNTQY